MPSQPGDIIWERIHAHAVGAVSIAPARTRQGQTLAVVAAGRMRSRSQDEAAKRAVSIHTLEQDEWQLNEGDDDVRAVALSEDGTLLAVGSADRTVCLYNLQTHAKLWDFRTQREITGLKISANGMVLAVTSSDGKFRLFSTLSNIPLYTVSASSPFTCVDATPDGRFAVIGTPSGEVFVINEHGQSIANDRTQRSSEIAGVAIDDAGRFVAIAATDDKVLHVHRANGQQLRSVTLDSPGRGVAMSADGSRIAVLTQSGTVTVCQTDSGAVLWQKPLGREGRSIAMTRDGQYVVVGSENGAVTVLSNASATPVNRPRDVSEPIAWMIPRILRDAYLDSPHRGVCLWYDLFDRGFAAGHVALCKALVEEFNRKPYTTNTREIQGAQTRAGMLSLYEGISAHRAGHTDEARAHYTNALAEYERADAGLGVTQAQALLEFSITPDVLDQIQLPRATDTSETYLHLRLRAIRSVPERLRVVRAAKDCGWLATLGKLVMESDDVSNGHLESPAVLASAIAACEHMQPTLQLPILMAVLDKSHWLVRWRVVAQQRLAAKNPATRTLIRDRYRPFLESALEHENVAEVREEITLLLREVS